MVILNTDDSEEFAVFVFIPFNDQAKLSIEPQGSLMTSLAAELLVVKTLECVEITFVRGTVYDVHHLKECIDDAVWILVCSLFLGVESFELIIGEEKSQRLLLCGAKAMIQRFTS